MGLAKKGTLYFLLFIFFLYSCDLTFHNPFLDTYEDKVTMPLMSPTGGTYSSDQNVTITCATSGATIYFTTDGSDPDGDSTQYTVPISVAGYGTNMTIKAIGIKSGMLDSTIRTELYSIQDNNPPVPGDSGNIITSNVQMNSIILTWTKATDNFTLQSNLQYRVYRSINNDIDTVDNIETNGTLIQDWISDIATYTANTLTDDTTYYFNIIVRDEENNKTAYSMMSVKTLADMTTYEVHWKLNDLTDSSGNGHTLWNYGATLTQNRILNPNSAYNFIPDYMDVYTTNELNFTTELTISVWIYITGDPNNNQKIMTKLNDSCTRGYSLGIYQSHIFVEVYDSTGIQYSYFDGAYVLSPIQWYHVVMTWKSGGNLKTYVNSGLDKSISVGSNQIGQDYDNYFAIGSGTNGPCFRFEGYIDDIRIYGKEMNDNEVLYLYNLPPD